MCAILPMHASLLQVVPEPVLAELAQLVRHYESQLVALLGQLLPQYAEEDILQVDTLPGCSAAVGTLFLEAEKACC